MYIINNGHGLFNVQTLWMKPNLIFWVILGGLIIVLSILVPFLIQCIQKKFLHRRTLSDTTHFIIIISGLILCSLIWITAFVGNKRCQQKLTFTSTKSNIARIYSYSSDVNVTPVSVLINDPNNSLWDTKNKSAIQYISLSDNFDNVNYSTTKHQKILEIQTTLTGKHSKIKLIPLNDLGRTYNRVCWYISKRNVYDLDIHITANGTIATYRKNPASLQKVKVRCLMDQRKALDQNADHIVELKM